MSEFAKVLLVNGSPRQYGCTYTALSEIADTLADEGVGSEFFWIGTEPMSGCIACKRCAELGRCIFNDRVNEFLDAADGFDGFIFGSPVHYAGISGSMTSFMDRVFFSTACSNRQSFFLKPGASIVSARRAGATAALDQMNKYILYNQMPVISSRYWSMVHGNTPEEVRQDAEGLQIMRTLARNMAWFLKCKSAAAAAGIPLPNVEARISTNFIR